MLSQTAEYALRAVVYLACHPGETATTHDLARASQVPPYYLSKVLQTLGKMGIVNAQRGKRGGFTLARPAQEMTILEVVNAVEPVQRIHRCPLGLREHNGKLCALHKRLDEAMMLVEEAFAQLTIASIVESDNNLRPLGEPEGARVG